MINEPKTSLKELITEKLSNINIKEFFNRDADTSMMKRVLAGFMIVVMVGLGYTGYKVNEIRTRAFDVYLGQEKIGSMRSQEEAIEIFNQVKKELSDKYEAEVVLDEELTFEPTHTKDEDLLNPQELKKTIDSKVGFLVAGAAIVVDGEEIGIFKTIEEANALIDKVKAPYIGDKTPEEINLVEDVQVVTKQISLNSLSNEEEVLDYIINGSEEIRTHTVEAGESFWTIARMYDTSVDELVLANNDKDPTKLKPGDEVKLLLPTSLITVETVEVVEYTEPINYEVKVEYDDSMYKNQKKVKVEGIKGESKILANEIRHNGILVDKQVINEEVLEEPKDQIVVQGTKEVPKHVATGSFSMPTRGRISSRYGMRWGRMHRGLDIAAKQGTAINAADGGTVTFAGYKGSYGYMVEINHNNGYVTRYAHCSKIHVKKGDKVAKGHHIANVGNTGRSTGAHLHFEVLKNGVHQNPSNFVK